MKQSSTVIHQSLILKTAQISLIVFLVVFTITCAIAGVGRNEKSLNLDDRMRFTITRNDGSVEHYEEPYFRPVHKGEKMEADVDAIGKKGFRHAALTFVLYHCEVTVYCGNERIYHQEPRARGQQIGGRLYTVSLPYDYQDKPIRIIADNSENDVFSSFENVRIVPDVKAMYSLLNGRIMSFLLFITLLTGSGFLFFYFIIRSLMEHHLEQGIYLSLFMILITVWYLGYANLFYVISDNENFCANVEYPALMFAPAAMGAYMICVIESPEWKKLIRKLTVILTGYGTVALLFSISPVDINYIDFMPFQHVLFLIMTIACISALIFDQKERRRDQLILRNGLIISMIIAGLELMRFVLFTHYGNHMRLLRIELAPFALLCVIMTFIISFASRMAEDSVARMQEAALRKLAYIDPLTGCPNRSAVEEKLDEMKEKNKQDYVMIFADINYLKKTNDTYGHEAGDHLIHKVSDLLEQYFHDSESFYGRWGGDEFIACVTGNEETAMRKITSFQKETSLSDPSEFPCGVSVSIGRCVSTSEHPVSITDAIRKADNEMYRIKKENHNNR